MPRTTPFQVLIKPVGADCNLRCEYCFYLRAGALYPETKRHIMPDEVLQKIVRELLGHRFPQTVFAWQGGEPTLAGVDFFRKVVAYEQQFGAPGQSVGNAIQTNGTLLDDEWCVLLRDYRFLVGLSMDGPEDVHDRHRVNVGGRGTWDKVMAAARLMERYQVSFNILCVVNNENARMGADLLRWFVAQGFPYVQFIPCVEKDSPYTVSAEDFGAFLCDTFDYWSKDGFGKVSIRDFDSMLAYRVDGTPAMCIYGNRCDHYILIEHNGDVYPCDFFAYTEWKLGNVLDAPLNTFFDTDLYKQFAYNKDKVAACRGCQWRPMCHGGCQKDRMLSGSLSDPTALCEGYKMLFTHANARLNVLAKRVRKSMRPG